MASSRFSVAVHALALLASESDKLLKSEYVACLIKTNPVVVRRLLADLARAGLVTSQAGAAGGTRLAKSAAEIDLFAVYQAVEDGQVFALHRKAPDERCRVGRSIQTVLYGIQARLDSSIKESLGEITIADVLEMIAAENDECRSKIKQANEQ